MSEPLRIDADLVRRLVATQFPEWADLPVRAIEPGGWDNRTFRLGEQLTARLPSAGRYAAAVEKEHAWLPRFAPHLPVAVPAPIAIGEPGEGYGFPWSIRRWLEGETVLACPPDLIQLASDLAGFLRAFQQLDAAGGPVAGKHSFFRGGPLATYDLQTRAAIEALGDRIDGSAATVVWEAALETEFQGPPVWVHGDIAPGNLLVRDGRLCAVIDFGQLAVGDPACDLAIAWTAFRGDSRHAFRRALPLDEGTWARGRGWTLWKSLILLAGAPAGPAHETAEAKRVLAEVLSEAPRG
jgi:aminoglycoside phosphotransferase (APT) family kinase protein